MERRLHGSLWQQVKKLTRSSYFLPVELEILMTAYAENEHTDKIDTVSAAKEPKLAWQNTVDQGNG